ncbi:MAG TPA: hypothetical protein VM489_15400 [Burkholderiales bacterium]|nr:hypothetical protein [Burkholderiales bacterium]
MKRLAGLLLAALLAFQAQAQPRTYHQGEQRIELALVVGPGLGLRLKGEQCGEEQSGQSRHSLIRRAAAPGVLVKL